MGSKHRNIILIVTIFTFVLLLTGGTYAWLLLGTTVGENTHESDATCFSMDYSGEFSTLLGDVNLDGEISEEDIELIRNYVSGTDLSAVQKKMADIDGDGMINVNDIGTISAIISGMEPKKTLPLFPSKTDKGGLFSEVTINIKEECDVTADGYIKLSIGADTASKYFMNSALRYSVYDSDNTTLIESGLLTTYGVKTLNANNPITLTKTATTYYVYVWLDGTKVDNSYLNLPFSATMYASAIQTES